MAVTSGYQTWIADAVRATGVPTHETSGWSTRGNVSFRPRGIVIHHDGFKAHVRTSDAVRLMRDGRLDLAGPLCAIWLDDDDESTAQPGDPAAHIIAAGRANHAGQGGWNGLVGNSSVLGIEARHSGGPNEPWSTAMYDAYVKICASLCAKGGFGSEMVCAHKEWTTRKPDPVSINMSEFRRRVKELIPSYQNPALVLPPAVVNNDAALSLTRLFTMNYDMNGGPHQLATLRQGATGDQVRVLQGVTRWLTGENLDIDGVFGPKTTDVVTRLQRLAKIAEDGIVGQRTWQVLRFFVYAKENQ